MLPPRSLTGSCLSDSNHPLPPLPQQHQPSVGLLLLLRRGLLAAAQQLPCHQRQPHHRPRRAAVIVGAAAASSGDPDSSSRGGSSSGRGRNTRRARQQQQQRQRQQQQQLQQQQPQQPLDWPLDWDGPPAGAGAAGPPEPARGSTRRSSSSSSKGGRRDRKPGYRATAAATRRGALRYDAAAAATSSSSGRSRRRSEFALDSDSDDDDDSDSDEDEDGDASFDDDDDDDDGVIPLADGDDDASGLLVIPLDRMDDPDIIKASSSSSTRGQPLSRAMQAAAAGGGRGGRRQGRRQPPPPMPGADAADTSVDAEAAAAEAFASAAAGMDLASLTRELQAAADANSARLAENAAAAAAAQGDQDEPEPWQPERLPPPPPPLQWLLLQDAELPGEESALGPTAGPGAGSGVYRFPSGRIDLDKTLGPALGQQQQGKQASGRQASSGQQQQQEWEQQGLIGSVDPSDEAGAAAEGELVARRLGMWRQGLAEVLLAEGLNPAADTVDLARALVGADDEGRGADGASAGAAKSVERPRSSSSSGDASEAAADAAPRTTSSSSTQQRRGFGSSSINQRVRQRQQQQRWQQRRRAQQQQQSGGRPVSEAELMFRMTGDAAFERSGQTVSPEDCGGGLRAEGSAGVREDAVDVEQLAGLMLMLYGSSDGGVSSIAPQQQPPEQARPAAVVGASPERLLLAAAPDLPRLAALLGRLLPPRTRGRPVLPPAVLAGAAAKGKVTPQQLQQWRQQWQQQQEEEATSPSPPAATAALSSRLSADDLVFAALRWGLLAKQLPPEATTPFFMHPALLSLTEACSAGVRAAAVAAATAAPGSSDAPQPWLSDVQAAALLRGLVAADTAMPQTLLVLLLAQVTAAGSGSSGSSSSSSTLGLCRLPAALAAGVLGAVGSLVAYQEIARDLRLVKLVDKTLVQFLNAYAVQPLNPAISQMSAADGATAALGLTRLARAPPGHFFDHVGSALSTCPGRLASASSASLAAVAAAAGGYAAAAAGGVSGRGLPAAAAAAAASGSSGGWRIAPDLLDCIAREFEARLALQRQECQERLAAALNAAAGADVFGVAGADDGDADSAGAATPVDDSDKQQQLSEGSVSRQLAAMAADKAAAGGDSSSSSRTGWQQQQKQRRGDGLGSSSSSAEPEPVLPLLPTQSARDAAVATALPAAALYVAPADAVVVLWALGHAGYQVSAFLASCLHVYGDDWPDLMEPEDCVMLLEGLAAAAPGSSAAKELGWQVTQLFLKGHTSRWVPGRLSPPVLLRLTGALVALGAVPGDTVVWPWLKAAVCFYSLYQPDELAAQVLAFARMGYVHTTFASLAVDTARSHVHLCSPTALADLALGFSRWQLEPRDLFPLLLAAAADQLGWFNEVQLVRLLEGLMMRQGLNLAPLYTAAQELLALAAEQPHTRCPRQQQQQQQPPLPLSTDSGGSLACVKLLQALPMWGVDASSSAASRWAFIQQLLAGMRRVALLLPVDDVYGLVQGVAHGARACAAAMQAAQDPIRQQQLCTLADQPQLLLPLVAAVALRAPEMAGAALIDSLAALQQLGATDVAAAAASSVPPVAGRSSSTSSSSGGPVSDVVGSGAAACQQHIRSLMGHLVKVLVVAVESGGLSPGGGSGGGVAALSDLADAAPTPVKVLALLAGILSSQLAPTPAAAAAGAAATASRAAAGPQQQQSLLTAAEAAAVTAVVVESAPDALPYLGLADIAALLAHLVTLSCSMPGVLTSARLQDTRCLPLLLEQVLRELGGSRISEQVLRMQVAEQQKQQEQPQQAQLCQRVVSDLVALGLQEAEVHARLPMFIVV